MHRRSLLASILTACAAPAIVRAGVLMPIAPRQVWVPQPSALFTGEVGRWDGMAICNVSEADLRALAQAKALGHWTRIDDAIRLSHLQSV